MQLRNKVVFITGGASGIGAACAKAVAEEGAKIVIADINTAKGQDLSESLNKEFGEGKVVFVKCDVADDAALKDAFKTAVTTFKQVDIMLNNAGIVDESYYPEHLVPVYVGTKHGIVGFTRSLADLPDIDKQGVRFACICPEMVDTPMVHDYKPNMCRKGYYEALLAVISQTKKISPDVVCEGLLSLVADDDSNGTLLHVSLTNGLVRKKINVEDA